MRKIPGLVLVVILVGCLAGQASAVSFNSSDIIDNSLFINTNALTNGSSNTAAACTTGCAWDPIQQFLTAQGGFLANWTDGVDIYNPNLQDSSGHNCLVHQHTDWTAAHIIWQAATSFQAQYIQWYDSSGNPVGHHYSGTLRSCNTVTYLTDDVPTVSSEVILTTLQKEQTLISRGGSYSSNSSDYDDPSCNYSGGICTNTQYALDWAMGYAVPDTGSRNHTYKGFYNQVNYAAWQLRFNYELSGGNTGWDSGAGGCYGGYTIQGTFATCPNGSAISHSGYATIDGTSTYISNQATAALYWYTPHFSGNQSFDSIYSGWFGSVNAAFMAKSSSNPQVYLVDSGTKYPVNSSDIFNAYNAFSFPTVAQSFLDSLATGYTLGHIGQDPNSSAIYLIDSAQKIKFASCSAMATYGYACSAPTMPPNVFTGLPTSIYTTSNLVRGYSSPNLFELVNGQRRYIPDVATLSAFGLNNTGTTFLEDTFVPQFPETAPLVRDQVIVTNSGGADVYLFLASAAMYIPNTSLFNDWQFNKLPLYIFNSYQVGRLTKGANVSAFAQDSSGNQYLIDTSTKRPLAGIASQWSSQFQTLNDTLIGAVPTGSSPGTLVKELGSPAVYSVEAQAKRLIPSYSDLTGSGLNPNNIVTIEATNLDPLPNGPLKLGPLRLIKQANSAQVNMVDGNISLILPSAQHATAFGLVLSNALTVDGNTWTAYPATGSINNLITDGTNHYLVDGGGRHLVSAATQTAYGYVNNQFLQLGAGTVTAITSSFDLTTFVQGSGSAIYQVQSGTKHPFASYQAYQTAGGNPSNTDLLSDWFLNSLPTGSMIF